MRKLKPFTAGCYSEYVLNPSLDPANADKAKEAGEGSDVPEKEAWADAATTSAAASSSSSSSSTPPYHAGLGARFKYPGDARKLREKSKMKLWRSYLSIHGRSLTTTRYPQFLRLVQVGLPSALRGEIWELTSGSIFNRFDHQGEFEAILKENEGRKTTATEEIEKDLHRSLPEYVGFQNEEGINSLRRVLYAFSFKNPEQGERDDGKTQGDPEELTIFSLAPVQHQATRKALTSWRPPSSSTAAKSRPTSSSTRCAIACFQATSHRAWQAQYWIDESLRIWCSAPCPSFMSIS